MAIYQLLAPAYDALCKTMVAGKCCLQAWLVRCITYMSGCRLNQDVRIPSGLPVILAQSREAPLVNCEDGYF
jgi:hypothetical protein